MQETKKEMEALAVEIISGMKEWRVQIPKTTFAENRAGNGEENGSPAVPVDGRNRPR